MTPFVEKLILIVVQYLAIAFVVAYAGYLFSRALERYKARQAIESELAKQRIKTIGECWSAMYIWEATLEELVHRADKIGRRYSNDREGYTTAVLAELSPLESESKAQSEAARSKVDENRFWLGEELYSSFREYYNTLMDWSIAFVENDQSKFKILETRKEKAKSDLAKTLKELE